MNIGLTFTRKGKGFGHIGPLTAKLLDAVVRKTTLRIEKGAKLKIMLPPKTGRIYKRGKRDHQASAPGEAPANDYGILVNSIKPRFVRKLEGIVSVTAEYAATLEFGGARVAKRPFLKPATNEQRKQFYLDCADAVKRGARG